MKKMRRVVAILLAGALICGLAACGSSDDTSSSEAAGSAEAETVEASTTDSDKDVLRICMASEPDYLDPALNSSVDGGCLAVNSFVGLYTYDADENLVPALGEVEVSDDALTYTFTMIESQWSNGEEVTANDFVYSWNRAADPATAADYSYLFDVVARNDDDTLAVEAVDDYTLVVTLVSPCPYFLSLTAFPTFYPVYQPDVEAADPEGTNPGAWAQEAGFVCNGAYTLESWNHDESMTYVANPYYYDAENVTMPTLEFMLSAEDTVMYAAYNSGDLDFIDSVPTDEIQALLDNPEFYIIDTLGTYYIGFNVQSPMFDGMTVEQAAGVREAISLLIDRDYIVDNIGQTGQELADSFIPIGMADGNGGIFKGADDSYFDATATGAGMADEAAALLEAAGFTMTDNGDGTYSMDPVLSFEYLLNESTAHEAIAQAIQQDLAVVGIEMTINVEDWNVVLEERKNGQYNGLTREGWIADYDDPINMLEIFTSDSGNNDMQLGKGDSAAAPDWDEYDALIDEIRTTTDFSARVDLMHEAEDMLMETWSVIPIYYYNDVYMMKPNVDGMYCTVTGMKYFMYCTKS